MPLVIKEGPCASSHGNGTIESPQINKTYVENAKVATITSKYICELHPDATIVNPICKKTYAENLLIAVDGAICSCDAVLIANCTKTSAE